MLFRTVRALCPKEAPETLRTVFTSAPLSEHLAKTIAAQKRGAMLVWLGVGGALWGIASSLHPTYFLACMVLGGVQATLSQSAQNRILGLQARRYVESCQISPDEGHQGRLKVLIKSPGLQRELGLEEVTQGSDVAVTLRDITVDTPIIHFDSAGDWSKDAELQELKDRAFRSTIVSEVIDISKIHDAELSQGLILPRLMDLTKENLEKIKVKGEKGRKMGLPIDASPQDALDRLAQSALFTGLVFSAAGLFSLQRRSRDSNAGLI
eukprot:GEMP01060019.1.p1 GENE.GEMP01060019.1~~GEMP01060019.1.p1  ORF type:complete len:266 (+),score=39.17 GEMP01060019.1:106-903(+)